MKYLNSNDLIEFSKDEAIKLKKKYKLTPEEYNEILRTILLMFQNYELKLIT